MPFEELFQAWFAYIVPTVKLSCAKDEPLMAFKVWIWQTMLSRRSIYNIANERKYFRSLQDYTPGLWNLLTRFSNQEASDKIFGLLGKVEWTEGYPWNVVADYSLTTREVYISTTKKEAMVSLYLLLIAETIGRLVSKENLPSWVPDFTKRRRGPASYMLNMAGDFPLPFLDRPHNPVFEYDPEVLIVEGVYVATITGAFVTYAPQLLNSEKADNDNSFTLIRYNTNPDQRPKKTADLEHWHPAGKELTFANTSWGPRLVQPGDIIILAQTSRLPLILRPLRAIGQSDDRVGEMENEGWLLVGACWLIEGSLRTDGVIPEKDPRFSKIMTGGLDEDVAFGRRVWEQWRLH